MASWGTTASHSHSCSAEPPLTMAILKPIPSCPSRLALGIRQSSKIRLAVEEARMPSLSSFFPSDSPGVGMGTRNALMPCNRSQTPRNGDDFPPTWVPAGFLQMLFTGAVRPERRGGLRQNNKARTHQPCSATPAQLEIPCMVPPELLQSGAPVTSFTPTPFPNRLVEHTLCFRALSVVANTTAAEASQALVIQALVPFRTHSSPSRRATVVAAPASLPFPAQGSTKTIQVVSSWRHLELCGVTIVTTVPPTVAPHRKGKSQWQSCHLQGSAGTGGMKLFSTGHMVPRVPWALRLHLNEAL